jgi:hypothetical protein
VSAGGDVARAREFTIGRIPLNLSANLSANLNATGDLALINPAYTFAAPVLGGQATVGLMSIYGRTATSLAGQLTGTLSIPGFVSIPFSRFDSISDSVTGFGDLYPQLFLRWNAGVHNYMIYITGDIPVGAYDSNRLSNIGLGHGAIDTGAGYTYLNPQTGQEFSAVLGFTYNFENKSTQYQNGVERKGKTPVLSPKEARRLLESIDVSTHAGLRDRALIGLMIYSFARIGAALAMKVEDVYVQNRRLWVRLHEKGGKRHEMPCHHNLESYLEAYLDGSDIRQDPKGPLFRTIGRNTRLLTRTPLPQANAYAMIRRRAAAAGIKTRIGNHTFRATGITAYLKNGGTLEQAAAMANHASTRTTQLYDRRRDELTLDEVERIFI